MHSRVRHPVPDPGMPAKPEPVFVYAGERGQAWGFSPKFLRGEADLVGRVAWTLTPRPT